MSRGAPTLRNVRAAAPDLEERADAPRSIAQPDPNLAPAREARPRVRLDLVRRGAATRPHFALGIGRAAYAPVIGRDGVGGVKEPQLTARSEVDATFAEALERRARAMAPAVDRRHNRVMMVEYDPAKKRWRDMLHRTPQRGVRAVPVQPPYAQKFVAPPRAEAAFAERRAPAQPPIGGLNGALAIGVLLMICPPLGVTLAWTSPHLSTTGKLALTGFGTTMMLIASVLAALTLSR